MSSGAEPARAPTPPEGRIARSWRLSGIAWRLVRADRTVLALAAASTLVTTGALAVTYDLTGLLPGQRVHAHEARLALVTLILAYPLTFVSVFFNTAIAAGVAAHLDGSPISIRAALAVPARRVGQVAVWSLLASFVGVLIEQIASRLPFAGGIAARLLGLGWSLASMFAVPILADEGCSAPTCLSRSAALVRRRWGEGVAGNVTITAWLVAVAIPLGALLGFGLASTRGSAGAHAAVIAVWVLLLVLVIAASSVVRQAFGVVLYRYAVSGHASGGFAAADLERPFSRGGLAMGRRSGGAEPRRRRSAGSVRAWLVCATLSLAATVVIEVGKTHWSRHVGARILTPVLLFLAICVLLRGLAAVGARIGRRARG